MRRTIADRMQASYQTTPHITFTSRVDMTEFEAVRTRLNFRAEAANGPHVTITALAVKLVAWALQNHPWLNSTLRGEEIHLMKRIHVGFAVAISEGLIVPVVHDADKKSVSQIASDVNDLSERARAGKLTPSDVVGGTFTISNLGPFGIEQFTAVINPGQAGILAIGAVQQEMVVVDGIAKIRPILRMTLSVDHRLVDGVVAARFLSDLRQAFETPSIVLW
jgi:pyruvate dehydrogenase E2 component (dihydrolipoamide acetyltransferase)